MGDDLAPQPFERKRNLSSRNFEKLGFRRRQSTNSNSSFESSNLSKQDSIDGNEVSSSSFNLSYSVNSDSENAFQAKSLQRMKSEPPGCDENLDDATSPSSDVSSPDPALLDVKQKVKRFEFLQAEDSIIFKVGKHLSKGGYLSSSNLSTQPLRVVSFHEQEQNAYVSASNPVLTSTRFSGFSDSIDEEHTEDDIDNFSESENDDGAESVEEGQEITEETAAPPAGTPENEHSEKLHRSASIATKHAQPKSKTPFIDGSKTVGRDFIRNFSSKNRPQTQAILALPSNHSADKSKSVYETTNNYFDEPEEEAELRNKCVIEVQKILEELIQTERNYVQNLTHNMARYGTIFERKDLPEGLRGKKYDLFGNIEQIVEFHRDEFLPMLEANSRDLKRIFDEFQRFIDENCFYSYVLYTMNKKTSLKLFAQYVKYFKLIENEINDPLGINSFLVEPIQRMPRYNLLLVEFIKKLFENSDFALKPIIKSCCSLEVKLRGLLHKVNNSETVNDIVNCHEVDIHLQGKFCKVDEFTVSDHNLRRSYRSKVFIFDKCIIYTEIKDHQLIFRGRYPCEHVGIEPKPKYLILYYEKRKQQECDFHADPKIIETWIELIRAMVSNYLKEERRKLQELYTTKTDHFHRKPPSLSLYRDSNRFSSDSGIGNIWVLPKPEIDETPLVANRSTWYT